MNAALDCQAVFTAQSTRGTRRQSALQDADAALNQLRLYLRLAHGWHWLNDGQYAYVSAHVAEIGCCWGLDQTNQHVKVGGRHGSKSRWRPASICARRDTTTCGRDSPAPSIAPELVRQTVVGRIFRRCRSTFRDDHDGDEHNTRKPMLSLRLSEPTIPPGCGRRERALAALLFQAPPRTTRPRLAGNPEPHLPSRFAIGDCH